MRKEWVKEYHTAVVGTTYHITIENNYLTLKAREKPYKITLHIKDLEKLIG